MSEGVRHGTAFAVQDAPAPQAAAPCRARRTEGWDGAALLQSASGTSKTVSFTCRSTILL